MIKADLHLHTRYSDGSDSLQETVRKCKNAGLSLIAITDHDRIPEIALLKDLSDEFQIEILPGVECGTRERGTGLDAHILGYGIQDFKELEKLMEPVRRKRHEISLWQIHRLKDFGYAVTLEEALKETDSGCLYRQHINYALYKKGQIDDMFGNWMQRMYRGKGPLKAVYEYPDTKDVIEAIKKGGGYPVLAHPGQQQNLCLVSSLCEAGLMGMELIHPSNTPFDIENIHQTAKEYRLFLTGGSDSHGVLSPKGGTIGEHYIELEKRESLFQI